MPSRTLWYWLVGCGFVLYAALLTCVWPFEIDDAYISMRYARNLVRGCGLTFNCGDPPFEGFTNMSLVLLEAAAMSVGLAGTWFPKTVNALAGVGLLGVLSWRSPDRSTTAALAVWSVATSAPFILWTAGGLETVLFASLATAGALLHSEQRFWTSQSLLLFATMTRPEGALFWTVSVAEGLLRTRSRWRPLAAGAAGLLLYALIKWQHFGAVVPATYGAKDHGFTLRTILGGAAKLLSFLSYNLNIAVLFMALGGAILHWRNARVQYLSLLLALYAAYLITRGYSVSMDHGFRLFVPLVALMGALLVSVAREVDGVVPTRVLLLTLACLLLSRSHDLRALWYVDINAASMRSQVPARELPLALERAHVAAGKWLGAHAPKGASVVAHSIGAIGWYSDLRVIDTWSLVTPELVRLRKKMRVDAAAQREARAWIVSQKPDFIAQDVFNVLGDKEVRAQFREIASYTFMRAGISDVFSGAPYVDSGLRLYARTSIGASPLE